MQNKGKIYHSMQAISILPILIFGILILFFGTYSFSKSMNKEVAAGLDTSSHLCISLINSTYPGDYTLVETTIDEKTAYSLYKGTTDITNRQDLVDTIKSDTNMDVSLFYQNTRILTTIKDWNGNRIIGTGAPDHIFRDIQQTKEPKFYDNVIINETVYFAYYHPLTNQNGDVVGMLFVGKPASNIRKMINASINPLIVVGIISLLLSVLISYHYAKNFLISLQKLKLFIRQIASGNLHTQVDPFLSKRNDELSEIAFSANIMQKALRNQIELDGLTGIYNRRTGLQKLQNTYVSSVTFHTPFCIVLGDIDFFKSVNDTYGHHNGDIVLQNIANTMKKHTIGKGYSIRWGGEEFLMVFENINLSQTLTIVEAIQEELREHIHILDDNQLHVTMTFGVVQNSHTEIKEMIKQADVLLYKGKEQGRNRIIS